MRGQLLGHRHAKRRCLHLGLRKRGAAWPRRQIRPIFTTKNRKFKSKGEIHQLRRCAYGFINRGRKAADGGERQGGAIGPIAKRREQFWLHSLGEIGVAIAGEVPDKEGELWRFAHYRLIGGESLNDIHAFIKLSSHF